MVYPTPEIMQNLGKFSRVKVLTVLGEDHPVRYFHVESFTPPLESL